VARWAPPVTCCRAPRPTARAASMTTHITPRWMDAHAYQEGAWAL